MFSDNTIVWTLCDKTTKSNVFINENKWLDNLFSYISKNNFNRINSNTFGLSLEWIALQIFLIPACLFPFFFSLLIFVFLILYFILYKKNVFIILFHILIDNTFIWLKLESIKPFILRDILLSWYWFECFWLPICPICETFKIFLTLTFTNFSICS